MARTIGKIDDKFFEYCTVIDAPATHLMTRDDFAAYYRREYGNSAMDIFAARMERADRKGTSSRTHDSFDEMISCNRYGDGETWLSVDDFKSRLKRETEVSAESNTLQRYARNPIMSQKIRIAVTVEGGVVTDVSTDSPALVDVIVIDLDDLDQTDPATNSPFADGSTLPQLTEEGQMFSVW